MLLVEGAKTLQFLSIYLTKETQILIDGLHLLEKEFVLTQEVYNLNQVFFYINLAAGIKNMYLDKHGACSVLSAFQTVVEEKLKINLTCSMGFVENFVSANSYRPSDIITSRKGLTVEIGNTDAEGRLVLADCMNWTQ